MSRTILHVDMDAFYAAVEIRQNPELRGKPVVIGGDPKGGRSRGVAMTANYEARKYGIRSAMPTSQAYRRCPHAVWVRPRMSLYAEISSRVFEIFRSYTDQVEGISLDEAFLDVTASERLFGTGPKIAAEIRSRIRDEERLTASVGVAASKYVAKVASDLEKPDALVVVPPGTERAFLAPLDVSRLWGAGPKAQARLHRLGLHKIGDIARLEPEVLQASLGDAMGRHFHALANGVDPRRVRRGPVRKSLSKERTFSEDVEDRTRVERTLLGLCEGVARALRRKRLAGRTVHVKLRWDGFETHTRQKTLRAPAMTTEEIWPVARDLFRATDDPTRRVRLIGVGVSGFDPAAAPQLALLDEEGLPAEPDGTGRKVAEAMDALADRFGGDAVTRAALLDWGRGSGFEGERKP
ncbi:MAG: DNA polymerase IV [Gemmatimonadetes bacterium]|nr:DNA polymerase IV [Gemmatimonadota bacterium]